MGKISIIIRNKNEERWIGHAIQSCLDFFNDPEIIIIDNESTDASMQIVNEFCFSDIKTYEMKGYTPGKALNYGVSKASNDIILVLSAHSQIIQDIKECDISKLLEEKCCVFGNQIPVYRGKKITKRYIWSHFVEEDVKNMWSESENRYFLHNAFSFFKRDFLIDNVFDETLPGKEDRYWVNKMIQKGYNTFYNHNMRCYHHWTPGGATWKGMG